MARANEKDVVRLGREIFDRMQGQSPSVFRKDYWSGKMMDWSMKDEAFKVEMFRFVDVFPTLSDHVQVAEHLQEYFCRPEQNFPSSFQWGLSKVKPESRIARMAAGQIEKQIVGMAERFIAGTNAEEALPTLEQMWAQGLCFTLDLLGEATVSEAEAGEYFERYVEILETLSAKSSAWPANPTLEQAKFGRVPRVNVSVKISSLFSQLDPIDPLGSVEGVKERLRPLFALARDKGAFINLDVEQYRYKDLTFAVFKSLLEEPEFKGFEHAGIVAQAYLRDCEEDLKALAKWAKKRGAPVTVRLVKGAYWDYETILAEQEGWPCPVFKKKWETDQSYERCTQVLLDNHRVLRAAIASHNVRSIAFAMAYANACRLDKSQIEFQMLYGMAEPMKAAVQGMGYRLRDYVPIGEMIPGMAYLVRRLLENTSNESWLRMSFVEGESIERLLAAPGPLDGAPAPGAEPEITSLNATGFRNEPLRDFARQSDRERMAQAVASVRKMFGRRYGAQVAYRELPATETLPSLNPAAPDEVVGEVGMASLRDTEEALQAASQAQQSWATTPVEERARLVLAVAEAMRRRRDELAAWMVWEVGKTWREADGDVCEAIDFCEYYAREAMELERPERLGRLPGELNELMYVPRGVSAVIAPWNFPLAILTGMTMAAAVTGNAVIMKPAEQSSVIAAQLMNLCNEVGFPPGVIGFLPGRGEVVGEALVTDARVHTVAFTGSMEVGLQIVEKAAKMAPGQAHVKHVVCEMGGKNAIIVDADADLDEAVTGVVHSAFGFQGQKCSACSRVIVHQSCYEAFKERLVEAVKSVLLGPPAEPGTKIGPVVDAQAKASIERYIALGRDEGRVLVQREVPESQGYYVGPTVIEGITPEHRLAQEEIFGPVLALMKAESFDQALAMANSTRFALTGGVYSRSPSNIARARREFAVGNLYINRGITGALVYRNPFGGFKLSGAGTKAGGPDYLLHFMNPRVVVENTMRRGFAPEID
ncbi:L-glutamate gamma-semialdehyde dehydrogenase [Lujinxingia litoralis]|uniref:L-glutamate gamma-semialdehyde dehydrogenase n=1 Tax=Lujinxingia litoralis TaxID=2211119 RepID=A0A328C425_9DELT|nr:L-glutamate gamma-semialdehyde dehydrogenase [Lujinxingia litoralis]RAL20052.1 L-glutamate gamma-semialdehyde dehydrogenase [Lujinxingia litoralis]